MGFCIGNSRPGSGSNSGGDGTLRGAIAVLEIYSRASSSCH